MSRKSFIGVDIGTSLIKMAEVQKNDSGLEVVSLRKSPTPQQKMMLGLRLKRWFLPEPGMRSPVSVMEMWFRLVQFPQLNKRN